MRTLGKYSSDPYSMDAPPYVGYDPTGTTDVPDVIIEPIKTGDGIEGDYIKVPNVPTFYYSGTVKDSATGKGIPGASVIFYAGGSRLGGVVADSNGNFSFESSQPAESITISSVGYQSFNWPASEYQNVFELERDEKELDPVVVTASRKNNSWIYLALLAGFAYESSKH